jgi:hypothetical protein
MKSATTPRCSKPPIPTGLQAARQTWHDAALPDGGCLAGFAPFRSLLMLLKCPRRVGGSGPWVVAQLSHISPSHTVQMGSRAMRKIYLGGSVETLLPQDSQLGEAAG